MNGDNQAHGPGWEGRIVRDLAHTQKKKMSRKTDIHEPQEKIRAYRTCNKDTRLFLTKYSQSHLWCHFRKLKAGTSLLPRFSGKRRSSFELCALKELSKMSTQVDSAVIKTTSIKPKTTTKKPKNQNQIFDRHTVVLTAPTWNSHAVTLS